MYVTLLRICMGWWFVISCDTYITHRNMNVNTVFDNHTNIYLRFVLAEQRYFVIRDETTNHQRKKKKLTTKLHIIL